ncbi:MAG: hypothetical protein LBT00_06495 [Spirochaetaceae bacterium]|nr:hypothetical protein [Spirochaetaceae bacterium]
MRVAKRRSNPDRGKPSHWIASLGNVPLARNDGERCHCESRSGEAIQPGKALALDCFASLAMTDRLLAMTGRPAHNDNPASLLLSQSP